eukprot:scaffold199270_cov31-Tisochrysis_lutea.AAC.2
MHLCRSAIDLHSNVRDEYIIDRRKCRWPRIQWTVCDECNVVVTAKQRIVITRRMERSLVVRVEFVLEHSDNLAAIIGVLFHQALQILQMKVGDTNRSDKTLGLHCSHFPPGFAPSSRGGAH